MALAIMLGFGAAMLMVELTLCAWRHRRRRLAVRRHPSGRRPRAATAGAVGGVGDDRVGDDRVGDDGAAGGVGGGTYHVTALDPEGIERLLTRRMLVGTITPEVYRHWMTRLAALPDGNPLSLDIARSCRLDAESRRLLARLATEMPELPLATLSAGVSLVRFGASVDDLVRLLGLDAEQALRIATTVTR